MSAIGTRSLAGAILTALLTGCASQSGANLPSGNPSRNTSAPSLSTAEVARIGSAGTVRVERRWNDQLYIATHPNTLSTCSDASGSGVHLGGGKVITAAHVVYGQNDLFCVPHISVVNGVEFVNTIPEFIPNYADAALTLDRLVSLRVADASGVTHNARAVALDFYLDLAILDVADLSQAASLSWGDSRALQVGDSVIAIGYPITGSTVTRGIVSALKTTDVVLRGTVDSVALVQTDAAVNPGNSGGPLLNENGGVVGIIDFRVEGGNYGLNFAVAASSAEPWVRDPRRCSPGAPRPNPNPPQPTSSSHPFGEPFYQATVSTCVR